MVIFKKLLRVFNIGLKSFFKIPWVNQTKKVDDRDHFQYFATKAGIGSTTYIIDERNDNRQFYITKIILQSIDIPQVDVLLDDPQDALHFDNLTRYQVYQFTFDKEPLVFKKQLRLNCIVAGANTFIVNCTIVGYVDL